MTSKRNTIRFAFSLGLTLATLLLVTACSRPKPILPKYMNRIQSARAVNIVPYGPTVHIGGSRAPGVIGLATDIATMGVAPEVQKRLDASVSSKVLVNHMSGVIQNGLTQTFGWDIVQDPKVPSDTRVEITVEAYGLYADSPESQVYFSLTADARIIFLPENRLIWASTESFYAPVKDVHLEGVGSVGSVVNLAVLLELPPEKFRDVMLAMSDEAGREIMAHMRADSVYVGEDE